MMVPLKVNLALTEVRVALFLAFERLERLYAEQATNPFSAMLEQQIQTTRRAISKYKYQLDVALVRSSWP